MKRYGLTKGEARKRRKSIRNSIKRLKGQLRGSLKHAPDGSHERIVIENNIRTLRVKENEITEFIDAQQSLFPTYNATAATG